MTHDKQCVVLSPNVTGKGLSPVRYIYATYISYYTYYISHYSILETVMYMYVLTMLPMYLLHWLFSVA